MPVCPFPGTHGWGYEGVSLWAVHEPYGGPDGLKRFVDTAHGLGLAVLLDVVHNHLGPSGNHLPAFGPYFTETHHTPWGRRSISTLPVRTRCAPSCWAARSAGCGTTGWTGCDWTRSTPWPTAGR